MDYIFRGIGWFLGWIDSWAGNYLVAILIFAFIVELLLLPFGIKQQKNSIRQAKLRPKEMAIRRKYAGRKDQATQQKITQEIQELYQKENFSPFAGCLPMLIQLPIILIIYQVVINPLQYVVGMDASVISALQEAFKVGDNGTVLSSFQLLNKLTDAGSYEAFVAMLPEGKVLSDVVANAIKELNFATLPDMTLFNLDWFNLGLTPGFYKPYTLLIIPALTFIVYFFSMKLNRKLSYQPNMAADDKQAACSNKMMEWMMPLMSLWIAFTVPALIGVYWIFKSILGTIKQFILAKAMPLPVCTEEDIKAAERELKGKAPAQEPISSAKVATTCMEPSVNFPPLTRKAPTLHTIRLATKAVSTPNSILLPMSFQEILFSNFITPSPFPLALCVQAKKKNRSNSFGSLKKVSYSSSAAGAAVSAWNLARVC